MVHIQVSVFSSLYDTYCIELCTFQLPMGSVISHGHGLVPSHPFLPETPLGDSPSNDSLPNSMEELVHGLKPMGTPIPVATVSGNKDRAQKERKATDPLMKKDTVRKKERQVGAKK